MGSKEQVFTVCGLLWGCKLDNPTALAPTIIVLHHIGVHNLSSITEHVLKVCRDEHMMVWSGSEHGDLKVDVAM